MIRHFLTINTVLFEEYVAFVNMKCLFLLLRSSLTSFYSSQQCLLLVFQNTTHCKYWWNRNVSTNKYTIITCVFLVYTCFILQLSRLFVYFIIIHQISHICQNFCSCLLFQIDVWFDSWIVCIDLYWDPTPRDADEGASAVKCVMIDMIDFPIYKWVVTFWVP